MAQYSKLLLAFVFCFFMADCRHVPPSTSSTNSNIHRTKNLTPYAYQLQRPLAYAKMKPDLGDFVVDDDDFFELNKRQTSDDYGHLRFGKRDEFDDYGHMRFGRNGLSVPETRD